MALKHKLVSLSENLFKTAIMTIEDIKKEESEHIDSNTIQLYIAKTG